MRCRSGPRSVSNQRKNSRTASYADRACTAEVDVHVPQQGTLEAGGLAEADVQSTSVTLPEGVQLNPSAADGLQACSEQQIGYEGPRRGRPAVAWRRATVAVLDGARGMSGCVEGRVSCTSHAAARTRTAGRGVSATPAPRMNGQNPFGSAAGAVHRRRRSVPGDPCEARGRNQAARQTGRITSTFLDTPQVPFEDFQLEFFGGPSGSLSTPPRAVAFRRARRLRRGRARRRRTCSPAPANSRSPRVLVAPRARRRRASLRVWWRGRVVCRRGRFRRFRCRWGVLMGIRRLWVFRCVCRGVWRRCFLRLCCVGNRRRRWGSVGRKAKLGRRARVRVLVLTRLLCRGAGCISLARMVVRRLGCRL